MKSTLKNTLKASKLGLLTIASALLFATIVGAPARAQNPPPGSIFQLDQQHPGVLSSYQQFTTSFTAGAGQTSAYVSFGFREVPAFFAFDDASVVDITHPSGNLLVNGDFSNAQVGQNFPTSWGRWIQPIDQSYVGLIANGPSNCAPNQGGPVSGGNYWCEGSVEGYDGLWQQIHTNPGDTYEISFYLGDNSGQAPNNPNIDAFVWAGESLPGGTENLPEPSSLALFGTGVLGLGAMVRRKLKL